MKKIEEDKSQIIQLEKMASLGTLSAGVAHEINNPLTFLITNLSLISSYAKEITDVKDIDDRNKTIANIEESVQECCDGANRIKRIVQDLLTFSHASKGRRSCDDINKLLDATIRILWNEIKYKADVVKDYKATTHVWVDANKVSQVFLNLILNAAAAIKQVTSQEKGTISVSTTEDDKNVIVKVIDTGPGIPKKVYSRIFDPFFTTKGGTGLGLHVSRKIIMNHGGALEVEATSGKGTTFVVSLPKGKSLKQDE
ncbi:MAG: GHKL domain-containing protein [Candidatus Omnitrophica bacterium]|nr:GHKL domain-containing protein [Candidatus Omnitrophota bacterium]